MSARMVLLGEFNPAIVSEPLEVGPVSPHAAATKAIAARAATDLVEQSFRFIRVPLILPCPGSRTRVGYRTFTGTSLLGSWRRGNAAEVIRLAQEFDVVCLGGGV